MHELSIVEALIDECGRLSDGHPVVRVRVRVGPALGADEVGQAFEMLKPGTVVAGADLEVEEAEVELRCECGRTGPAGRQDAGGHVVVCPGCGRAHSVPGGLELVRLSFDG